MSSKVQLTYNNDEYIISVNESVIHREADLEKAIIRFKQAVTNNNYYQVVTWEDIEKDLLNYKDERLKVNDEYKTVSFGNMKFFYTTGKVFLVSETQMAPLLGGYHFFSSILNIAVNEGFNDSDELVELCNRVLEENATYRITESTITIASPIFNYGLVEYNFSNKKMNTGVAIEKSDFNEFRKYVLKLL